MAFWDWSRWEFMLDWAALHGVNLPLSFTGERKEGSDSKSSTPPPPFHQLLLGFYPKPRPRICVVCYIFQIGHDR